MSLALLRHLESKQTLLPVNVMSAFSSKAEIGGQECNYVPSSLRLGFQLNEGLVGHIKALCKNSRHVDEQGRVL